MKVLKNSYKVARSVLFSALILAAVIYLAAYVFVSMPAVENKIRERAETELSKLLGGRLEIGEIDISPFSEVGLERVALYTPAGEKCAYVEKLAAGINLWKLIAEKKIELTYSEIIGLDARLWQQNADAPLNIDFIIKALASKDRNKPPTPFDLKFHNVVIRRCSFSFDRRWLPENGDPSRMDFNHIRVSDIRADIYLPRIKNDDFKIDLRRLSFKAASLVLEKLALRLHLTPTSLSVEDLVIKLPDTEITPSDIVLNYNGYGDIVNSLKRETHDLVLVDNPVNPADLMGVVPALGRFPGNYLLSLDVSGSGESVTVRRFVLKRATPLLSLEFAGNVHGGMSDRITADIENLRLVASSGYVRDITDRVSALPQGVAAKINALGDLELLMKGKSDFLLDDGKVRHIRAKSEILLDTRAGEIVVDGDGIWNSGNVLDSRIKVYSPGLDPADVMPELGIGKFSFDLSAEMRGPVGNPEGTLELAVPDIIYKGVTVSDITVSAEKTGSLVTAAFGVDSDVAEADGEGRMTLDGAASILLADINVDHVVPSAFGVMKSYSGYSLGGRISLDLKGNNVNNVVGTVDIDDFFFRSPLPSGKSLLMSQLRLSADESEGFRQIALRSDWVDVDAGGHFDISSLPSEIVASVGECLPELVISRREWTPSDSYMDVSVTLKRDNPLSGFFKLPVSLLTDIPVRGSYSGKDGTLSFAVDAPYLKQGTNKLIQNTHVAASLNASGSTSDLTASTVVPAKKGDLRINLGIRGLYEDFLADIALKSINSEGGPSVDGNISLGLSVARSDRLGPPMIDLLIHESRLDIGKATWNLDRGGVSYGDGRIDINSIKAWHENQFVEIQGTASPYPEDVVNVSLSDFDLNYLFETLNINFVTFGGHATGEIAGSGLLSKTPVAETKSLYVKNLSYNGAVLGNADLSSHWDNERKMVGIRADIRDSIPRAVVDGGIWVTRDSLSFDIDASKVDVAFLKPFMVAFTSDVRGRASGKAKLYGNFSDIDLTGRLFADTLTMKVDYTNVYYSGSDSVIMTPGRIDIPHFRLYDKYGHSAMFSGEVRHRYFHDPSFDFRLTGARNLLCYDTNASMNPDWYGTIYGSGYGSVRGWPGVVSITVDMTTQSPSHFTFVLNDTQAAADYRFLTFSDRKKERLMELAPDSVPDFVTMFKRKVAEQEQGRPSLFSMGIRATVTPGTLLTLVMDPVGGDKINARGNGAMQIDYDSESDNMLMYGKYVLEEGNYNFTLQDLILKDFTIRPGSSISFNGDPMRADLDITAAYRVNTNLSDLDKSFSTDKDLNRTNVPVDAMLKVQGDMRAPDISFDIELPTLTQDVERKVKSIVSTEDMMNQQIIYLLALNRFYTPEYMGGSNGGELASVASSTLSSQLVNMMGQLTDKFTLAPSIRSDKGDFSDVEVDLALSSRLLNNRLLINGNFGYRDRSTSSTTFIGDFDLEYLLSKNGNLRLKAYNHFNDQNYYLRSALTTQGIGVVYRRDFDNPFTFLRRHKKSDGKKDDGKRNEAVADSVAGSAAVNRKSEGAAE